MALPPQAYKWTKLIDIIDHGTVDELTDAIVKSCQILTELKAALLPITQNSIGIDDDPAKEDIRRLIDSIEELEKQREGRRTVVGVVGSTGAGKSSIINAVLDEERLVPTSAMRACTATITELSWNDDDSPGRKYRAEVEFIGGDDWAKDLRILFGELSDLNVDPEATTDTDSDAGIILAKVRAVYPALNKDSLKKGASIIDELVGTPEVRKVLGTTKSLQASSAQALYDQVQFYVDSRDKKDKNKTAMSTLAFGEGGADFLQVGCAEKWVGSGRPCKL